MFMCSVQNSYSIANLWLGKPQGTESNWLLPPLPWLLLPLCVCLGKIEHLQEHYLMQGLIIQVPGNEIMYLIENTK